jgi:hypothetical protein
MIQCSSDLRDAAGANRLVQNDGYLIEFTGLLAWAGDDEERRGMRRLVG